MPNPPEMTARREQCADLLALPDLTEDERAEIEAYISGKSANLFFRCQWTEDPRIAAAHQRGRLEGLEEAAKIADDYASNADDECVGAVSACGDVAQAIRSRITEGK